MKTSEFSQEGLDKFAAVFAAQADVHEAYVSTYGEWLPIEVCDELEAAAEHLLQAAWILNPSLLDEDESEGADPK